MKVMSLALNGGAQPQAPSFTNFLSTLSRAEKSSPDGAAGTGAAGTAVIASQDLVINRNAIEILGACVCMTALSTASCVGPEVGLAPMPTVAAHKAAHKDAHDFTKALLALGTPDDERCTDKIRDVSGHWHVFSHASPVSCTSLTEPWPSQVCRCFCLTETGHFPCTFHPHCLPQN